MILTIPTCRSNWALTSPPSHKQKHNKLWRKTNYKTANPTLRHIITISCVSSSSSSAESLCLLGFLGGESFNPTRMIKAPSPMPTITTQKIRATTANKIFRVPRAVPKVPESAVLLETRLSPLPLGRPRSKWKMKIRKGVDKEPKIADGPYNKLPCSTFPILPGFFEALFEYRRYSGLPIYFFPPLHTPKRKNKLGVNKHIFSNKNSV
jgi:hypothetical protein